MDGEESANLRTVEPNGVQNEKSRKVQSEKSANLQAEERDGVQGETSE